MQKAKERKSNLNEVRVHYTSLQDAPERRCAGLSKKAGGVGRRITAWSFSIKQEKVLPPKHRGKARRKFQENKKGRDRLKT